VLLNQMKDKHNERCHASQAIKKNESVSIFHNNLSR